MQPLYDFGIAQEDPLTEYRLLQAEPGDQVLAVASAGEVPLTLLSIQEGIHITAVDISATQLMLCRLKLAAAIHLDFPLNAGFLGYTAIAENMRPSLYSGILASHLPEEDQQFWNQHMELIRAGVVNKGRFERYIKKLRWLINLLIGKHTIRQLAAITNTGEAAAFFDRHIAGRKAVRLLFKLAFHPAVYKKRGLSAEGLKHATASTGELFFMKFRDFCTGTPPVKNYFLQYFLIGECVATEALPEYLQEENKIRLDKNRMHITWKNCSLQEELAAQAPGTYNKIHLSNIGDWMSAEDFEKLMDVFCSRIKNQTLSCYRFLQKNHLEACKQHSNGITVTPVPVNKTDRFPFYSLLVIQGHEQN